VYTISLAVNLFLEVVIAKALDGVEAGAVLSGYNIPI